MQLTREIEQIKKRRRSVTAREMDRLLRAAGFTVRQGKGDHVIYTHPARPFPLTIDPRRPHLLPAYVSKALRAIEEVIDA